MSDSEESQRDNGSIYSSSSPSLSSSHASDTSDSENESVIVGPYMFEPVVSAESQSQDHRSSDSSSGEDEAHRLLNKDW